MSAESLHGYRRLGLAVTLSGALAVSGCGVVDRVFGDDKGSGEKQTELCAGPAKTTDAFPRLKFNALGGGSPAIFVYAGAGEAPADKEQRGYYCNNDEIAVRCQRVGRLVVSHPKVGEARRESTDWYQLQPVSGATDGPFATATYGDIITNATPVQECQNS